MNEIGVLVGGCACVAIAVGILVASAIARGGSTAGRFGGIAIGLIVLVAGLAILSRVYEVSAALLLPVIVGAAFVGAAGGLLFQGSRQMYRR